MDGGTFDRLTRLLAGRLTRRTGLAASLGALAAGAGGSAPVLEARRRDRDRDRRRPDRAAGRADGAGVIDEKKPCGPKARDNRCRKHRQCCTKYCRKPKAGQKYGRCRCIKPGRKCKNGQTCCGGALCQDKRCTLQPTPEGCGAAGGACTADASCCTGLLCKNGTCAACGADGGACTSESDCCAGLLCKSGACAPCTATVCASGCAFTSVNTAYAAAAAGDTIYIGPGTYPTGVVITKNVTLAACPGVTGVVIEPDRVMKEDYYFVALTDEDGGTTQHQVTLRNLTFRGTADGFTAQDEALVTSSFTGLVTYTVEDCAFEQGYHGIFVKSNSITITDSTFDNFTYAGFYHSYVDNSWSLNSTISGCTFSNCTEGGVYISPDSYAADCTVTGCTFTSNLGYGAIIYGEDDDNTRGTRKLTVINSTFSNGVVTDNYYIRVRGSTGAISGCTLKDGKTTALSVDDSSIKVTDTLIQNNTGDPSLNGGGMYILRSTNHPMTIELAGTTLITGNQAAPPPRTGGGIYYQNEPGVGSATFTGIAPRVTGNTPYDCVTMSSGQVSCSAL